MTDVRIKKLLREIFRPEKVGKVKNLEIYAKLRGLCRSTIIMIIKLPIKNDGNILSSKNAWS